MQIYICIINDINIKQYSSPGEYQPNQQYKALIIEFNFMHIAKDVNNPK